MNGTYPTLVKRELWEHRWLWLAPVVVAGLILLVGVFGVIATQGSDYQFRLPRGTNLGEGVGMPGSSAMYIGIFGLTTQLYIVAGIVATFYLLDSLYAERKDRSILFWKSLPVSDFQTVAAKYAVGMLTPPLLGIVLVTVVYPLLHTMSIMGVPGFAEAAGGWNVGDWLRAEARIAGSLFVTTLWLAPVGAWYMLASVISSRSPYFLAGMPIVVLGVCESMLLHTGHVWRFVVWRMTPVFQPLEGLQRPSLWIGLAVAAGMLYIVIRLRRYRDDT